MEDICSQRGGVTLVFLRGHVRRSLPILYPKLIIGRPIKVYSRLIALNLPEIGLAEVDTVMVGSVCGLVAVQRVLNVLTSYSRPYVCAD